MENTLVLVVHGIGEQSPGETIDALTGGAVQEMGLTGPIEGRTEMIAEQVEGSEHLNLFPCTIRRTVLPAGSQPGLATDQTVTAAEVYWSDLSPAPKGPLGTAFDLLHTILGLGYLALDNVDRSNGAVSAGSRRGVHAFVWIFYALIAPLNALMLVGTLALLIDLVLPLGPLADGHLPGALLFALVGGLVAALCRYWRRTIWTERSSYMLSAFMQGLGAMAAGLAVFSLLVWLSGDAAWVRTLRLAACQSVESTACWSPQYEDVAMIAWLSTLVTAVIWLAAMLILLALFLTTTLSDLGLRRTLMLFGIPILLIVATQMAARETWPWLLLGAMGLGTGLLAISARTRRAMRAGLGRITRFFSQRELIYQSVCNAMLILWMLISAALWALFSGALQTLDGADGAQTLMTLIYQDYSGLLTSALAYVMIAVGALVLIGAVPIVIRGIQRNKLAADPPTSLDVWCGRLILNPVVNLLLFVLILWMAFGGLFQALLTSMTVFGRVFRDPFTGEVFLHRVDPQTGATMWTADSVIVTLNAFHNSITGMNGLALGAAALLGVAIYKRWDFIAAALGIARDISVYSTRTAAEAPGPGTRSRYVQRERILNRFRLVHDHLARQMDYDRLIVVAHSQGTVVAAQSLTSDHLPDRPRYLLTMGSPLTHIYGQYFAKGFALAPLPDRLVRWINIYRCDDFVGTRVRAGDAAVENLRVAANGHTGYWTDRNVWAALKGALDHHDRMGDSPDRPPVA